MRRRDIAYALGVGGVQKGPWRPSADEAMSDALEMDFASVCELTGERYLHVLASIHHTAEEVEVVPRELCTMGDIFGRSVVKDIAPKNGPTSDKPLTRIERIIARREAQNSAEAA